MLRGLPYLGFAIFIVFADATVCAQELRKRTDSEGNVHYGTTKNPNLCCMCQPALGFKSHSSITVFSLQYGLERVVGNDRVFLSEDRKAWYCEGNRDSGKLDKKCGLVPSAM